LKLLVIEDDFSIVDIVSLSCQVGWPEVEVISTELGEEGVEMVESESPDVVLLDLGLPDISGFEVLKGIRLFSNVPVIILTVREEESSIVKALEWGADGYIIKPFRQLELLARIKAMVRRVHPEKALYEECGPFRFDFSAHKVKHGKQDILLTRTEFIILYYLAANRGAVLTYSSIAQRVWGDYFPGSVEALRVHIRCLRQKIEADSNSPQLILTKSREGYFLA